jgi:hypothetical protein
MAREWLTSNGTIATGALGVTALGIVIREWILGVIETIGSIGSGIGFVLGGFGSFIESLISAFFGSIIGAIRGSFAANATWISETFGILAPAVAIVEIVIIVWLLGATISIALRSVSEGVR